MRVTNKPKRVPTSIGNRILIKTFYALCKKGSNGSIFAKLCDGGAGRRVPQSLIIAALHVIIYRPPCLFFSDKD